MTEEYVCIRKDLYEDRGFYVCVSERGGKYLHRDGEVYDGVSPRGESGGGFWNTTSEASDAYQNYLSSL